MLVMHRGTSGSGTNASGTSGTVAGACTNCGAPLQLDPDGTCRWCHATLLAAPRSEAPQSQAPHSQPPRRHFTFFGDDTALLPGGVDNCSTSAPFLYLTLTTFGSVLSLEPAVQDDIRRQQGMHQKIRELCTAVSEAGVRVRDAGLIKDDFDDNLKVYTPEEIWTFDLAIDVIAMLGTLDGLPGDSRARIASNLRSLDQSVTEHTWKKELKKAGDGPARFRELRASVPRHAPHPGR
jgi:hypothetical protein